MRNLTLPALVTAEAVSSTGSAMTFVALPWFVLVTSGSATKMSIVLAAELCHGGFRDPERLGRRATGARSRCSSRISCAHRSSLLVPILHWTGHLTFPLLLGIVFVLGIFMAPYAASQRSILPEVFGDDEKTSRRPRACSAARSTCRS